MAQAKPAVSQEAEDDGEWTCTKDFSFHTGRMLLSYKRGQTIDDPHELKQIREAFKTSKVPLRKLTDRDLLG